MNARDEETGGALLRLDGMSVDIAGRRIVDQVVLTAACVPAPGARRVREAPPATTV